MVTIIDSKGGTWESRAAASMTPAARQTWEARIAGQSFKPPPAVPVALYSGISEPHRKRLARSETPPHWLIDDTPGGKWLAQGLGAGLLKKDFGPNWNGAYRDVWVMASLAYIKNARGHVIIYTSSNRIDPAKAAAAAGKTTIELDDVLNPVFYDELINLDVLSPLKSNHAITGVTIKEVQGGRVVGIMPVRGSQQFH